MTTKKRSYRRALMRIAVANTKATLQIKTTIKGVVAISLAVAVYLVIIFFDTSGLGLDGVSIKGAIIAAITIASLVAATDTIFGFIGDIGKNSYPTDLKAAKTDSKVSFARTWVRVFAAICGAFLIGQLISTLPSLVPTAGSKWAPPPGEKVSPNQATGQENLNGQYMIVNVETPVRRQPPKSAGTQKPVPANIPCCDHCLENSAKNEIKNENAASKLKEPTFACGQAPQMHTGQR